MKLALHQLCLETSHPIQVIDITAQVRGLVDESGIRDGLLTVISNHTTAFVSLNESEARLQEDMVEFLTRFAPKGAAYRHDLEPVDDRPNAHAHLAGLFMSASQSIPLSGGKLVLGAWQAILFVEMDGPREARTVNVHVLGEGHE
jgi:secondary thiamine-phosphate synthase enzyme